MSVRRIRFAKREPARFVEEVKGGVERYFAETGRSTKANGPMVLKTVVLLALTFGAYGAILSNRYAPGAMLALAIAIGFPAGVLAAARRNRAPDLAIMGQPPAGTEMVAKPFLQNPMVVIAAPAHALAGSSHIQANQLAKETFLLRETGSGTRGVVERYFASHKLPLPVHMEMDTNEAIKQSVQAGMGIGIISRHGIELELETGRLVILDVASFPIVRHWYIVQRKDKRPSTAVMEFEKYLIAQSQLDSMDK